MKVFPHQFIERHSGKVHTERLPADHMVNFLYSLARENAPVLFRALISARASQFLASVQFDLGVSWRVRSLLQEWRIDPRELRDDLNSLDSPRKIFERKIRYEQYRPMPDDEHAVVSPADSRVALGSLRETSNLYLKEKFFNLEELLGLDKPDWIKAFQYGDFAIFRLTPDKYHYNHTPVSGLVKDFYEIPGTYHSCNPSAVITVVTPYSKNRRVVTIFDTDVPGGTGCGLVAMIEVVALMIGDVVQAYSEVGYENPQPIKIGMFLKKGCPKSLYRPGSSTDVLLFQQNRIRFAEDLVKNASRTDVKSRFSHGFGKPVIETDLRARSLVGSAVREPLNAANKFN